MIISCSESTYGMTEEGRVSETIALLLALGDFPMGAIQPTVKLGFIGEFVDQNKDETSMHVYSFTRLRAGAPSRREP